MRHHIVSFVLGAAIVCVGIFAAGLFMTFVTMVFETYEIEGWMMFLVVAGAGGLGNMAIRWQDDRITWKD